MWITFKALLAGALRDRISLVWAVACPLLLLGVLGYLYPSSAYRYQLVVGLVAVSVIFFTAMGTGFEVMRQRRQGVYKLLRATPFRTSAFVSVLTGVRSLVALSASIVVLTTGLVGFQLSIGITGALLLLLVLTLGTLCFTFLGFTFGNLSGQEQQVAMMNNLIVTPMLFLSETFYSLTKAPEWVKWISKALPISHFLDAIRFAAAGDVAGAAIPTLILVGFTVLTLALSVWTFSWDPNAHTRQA